MPTLVQNSATKSSKHDVLSNEKLSDIVARKGYCHGLDCGEYTIRRAEEILQAEEGLVVLTLSGPKVKFKDLFLDRNGYLGSENHLTSRHSPKPRDMQSAIFRPTGGQRGEIECAFYDGSRRDCPDVEKIKKKKKKKKKKLSTSDRARDFSAPETCARKCCGESNKGC